MLARAQGQMMTLMHTPLDDLHRELGAKMVPFAGYDMPVQYPAGIIKEHLHTRAAAGLFDVSHMGQVIVEGTGSAAMLESLVPVDIEALGINRQTYALFTTDRGGVSDTCGRICLGKSSQCWSSRPCWPCRGRPRAK
jgi:aminomethyltransferase